MMHYRWRSVAFLLVLILSLGGATCKKGGEDSDEVKKIETVPEDSDDGHEDESGTDDPSTDEEI